MRKFRGTPIIPEGVDLIKPFFWTEQALYILDQRKLPLQEVYYEANSLKKVYVAIRDMLVRGAPAIGIVAGIGVFIALKENLNRVNFPLSRKRLEREFDKIVEKLASSRPTAVNLFWALERMRKVFHGEMATFPSNLEREHYEKLLEVLKKEALRIWEEDLRANREMGRIGGAILPEGYVLTHCNTGALATGGYGTALGVIRFAIEQGKKIQVWVDETRPFLQGARLTAWELSKLKIPFKIITDNSAGFLMKKGLVQAVIVGADRIALNGDTANKIGTYALAVLAKYHGIPFYVTAPIATFDHSLEKGEGIPIEERAEKEVLFCHRSRVAPQKARALNLAFDVTPGELITAFITERGVIEPPFEINIRRTLGLV